MKTTDNKQMKLSVDIDEETAKGNYYNMFIINFSENEFTIDCGFNSPGFKKIKISNRLIVSPGQMEKLSAVIQESLRKYKDKYENKPEGKLIN
ncbi:MAG: DUF3467 domain-containing protein [Deltaproteobacteria bacterium]|jgi:hypothetical protein|nr:DUF3467 domain-containing protein [Deltaproteobacteria bacterium]